MQGLQWQRRRKLRPARVVSKEGNFSDYRHPHCNRDDLPVYPVNKKLGN
jgi:hypothetical protein